MSWPEVYGLLITATGWTWEYIDDHMTLPRYNELRDYWAENPPVHIMVAAYLLGKGEKGSSEEPGVLKGEAAAAAIMSMFPMSAGAAR